MMLQNTGSVLSIAFVLAIITAAVPTRSCCRSSPASLELGRRAGAVHPQHARRAVGPGRHRGRRRGGLAAAAQGRRPAEREGRGVSTPSAPEPAALRIGEVAKLVGTTPRTIRYYEEIGLLTGGGGTARPASTAPTARPRSSACARRCASSAARRHAGRAQELLAAEEARRRCARSGTTATRARRRREILDRALAHVDRQAELLRAPPRRDRRLERELEERARRQREQAGRAGLSGSGGSRAARYPSIGAVADDARSRRS